MGMLLTEKLKKRLESQGIFFAVKKTKKNFFSSGYRQIGIRRLYFRSRWEANYARYLEFLKMKGEIKEWLHEPKTFWFESIKRGVRSYLPDFKVIDNQNAHKWVEVKGYYDKRSITKIKRFKRYFPNETLELIDKEWFQLNSPQLKKIIPYWEND